ncbi:MAG: hypothetical protein ABSD71_14620 [Bacteroidales bacterium]|jgi:hypothetical protein
MTRFRAAITRGASLINPDTIEINDSSVIYKKRRVYLLGYDTILIPFSKISSVELNTSFIGTSITITSFGEGIIAAHRFALNDAKAIKQLIEEQL